MAGNPCPPRVSRLIPGSISVPDTGSLKPDGTLRAASAHLHAGRLRDAEALCRAALNTTPGNPDALNLLGLVATRAGNPKAAAQLFAQALIRAPHHVAALFNLGNALQAQGLLQAAIESYDKALVLAPAHTDALNNKGGALQYLGQLDEAIESYRRALAVNPKSVAALNNLAGALQLQGEFAESVDAYHAALALNPDYDEAHSSLLMALSIWPACTPEQYLAQAKQYGAKVGARARPHSRWPAALAWREGDPLRVGMVSGDLRTNPVGYFLEAVLEHINPARLQLVAYTTTRREDALTTRIKPKFTAWHSIAGLGDEAAAGKIHQDQMHILIDLAGHTVNNRLPLFAWKPAPVQLSWLGYFASTGVGAIDYLLADRASIADAEPAPFTEQVWTLPDTRLCFTPPAGAPDVAPMPALHNGYITFGCFQRLAKLNDEVLRLWGRVMHALPDSRLRLQMIEMRWPAAREKLLKRLARAGIAPERATIHPEAPRDAYLAAHTEVDLILDTFPFPGGTTTCEALWMGVPTLTLRGASLLARQGASLLGCAGLHGWIAEDKNDYVARATAHATDIAMLAALRAGLRAQTRQSPLCDAARFTSNLQVALLGMWQQRQRSDA